MGGSDRGRATEFGDKKGFGETGQNRRLVDGFRQLPLDFRWSISEARIGLVMDGHADGTVRVFIAVIMVMERLTQEGEEQEAYEDE
jgi:hypothetical protein